MPRTTPSRIPGGSNVLVVVMLLATTATLSSRKFILYTHRLYRTLWCMRKPAHGPAQLIWTQPPPPPRQRSLGREDIVAAAIGLADEAGPDALTMKAVAGRLGSYSAMALYRYVHSKDGLVDLMLDAATAEIPVPPSPGPDWRADLQALAGQTREMTKRHPWYAALYHTRPPAGPHMMQRL